MNEGRLKSLLRETPVPGAEEAERRGRRVVRVAFAQRQPDRRDGRRQLRIAVALGALLAALILSPAGATVRDWVDDVFTAGVPDAEPGLTEIPGGGRLLVQSAAGPWVVQADGSRRLLGGYAEASWSPRGLFVAAAAGNVLSAVEPAGTPRWSLSADAPVADTRWSPSGFQIAYRAGAELRVVAADGGEDVLVGRAATRAAPAWSPQGLPLLAYVDAEHRLRIANAETAEDVGSGAALAGIEGLEWAGESTLLEVSPTALRLRELNPRKLLGRLSIGGGRELPLPAGATIRDAALSPDGETVAALLALGTPAAPRSAVVLIGTRSMASRPLFSSPGRLSELAFSPDGSRLLISWPDADQWLFIPADGPGRVRAIGNIAAQFAPGSEGGGAFPRISGWCCPARVAAGPG